MPYTDAQNRATQKYIKENLEEVRFRVRKGEKAVLQGAAREAGQSMAQYVIQAINERAGCQLLTPTDAPAASGMDAGEQKTPQP